MQNTLTPQDRDADERYAPHLAGSHDNLGVHPERREAEVADLEKMYSGGGESNAEEAAGSTGMASSLKGKAVNIAPLAQQEKSAASDIVGKGFEPNLSGKKTGINSRLPSWITKKRAGIAGGITGVTTTGVILGLLGIGSGPAHVIHVAQILNLTNNRESVVSRIRSNNLYRYAKTGDVGETRVGRVGSKVFGSTIEELKAVGVEFQRSNTGNPKSMTVDTSKNPDFKGMSDAEAKAAVAKKFGLSESQLSKISGVNGGAKFAVNTRDIGMQASRALTKNTVASLENGKVLSAMKFRVMAKFFNTPSLFHPWEKAKATLENKLTTVLERKAAEKDRLAKRKPPLSPEAQASLDRIKGNLDPIKSGAQKVLLLSAAMCIARSVADDLITVNQAQIVIPAATGAIDTQAAGSQTQFGSDFTLGQVGAKEASFRADDGTSVEDGRAFQALTDPTATGGKDISGDYAQAFSSDNSASVIKNTLGGGAFGGVVCSPIGQILQAAGAVAFFVTGFFDGGLSWAAVGAKVGTEFAQGVATAGAMALLEHKAVDILASKAIVPELLSGAEGGNLMAYGAREAANMSARASGGVALDAAGSAAVDAQQVLGSNEEFKTRSLYVRLFDKNDYRSLTSRVSMAIGTSPAQKVPQYLSDLNFGSIFSGMFSSLLPKTSAAATPYLWSFPRYTIPDTLLNDPNYEDPYANGAAVAQLLDRPGSDAYIGRALACFGASISKENADKVWEVTPQEMPNPQSSEYTDSKCNDLSDANWKRIMLFITDSRTIDAAACYEGDEDACKRVDGEAAPSPTTPAGNGAVSLTGWSWPVSQGDWSGPFGYNVWGNVYCGASCGRHEGVDFPISATTPVLVAHDGVVKDVSFNGDCQWSVLISVNGQGVFQGYQHLTQPLLLTGQSVTAGTKIGTIFPSASGKCIQGAHLHFSIEKTAQISSYLDGAGKTDAQMPTLPPLCVLPNDGRNYGPYVPAANIIGSAYCSQLTGGL